MADYDVLVAMLRRAGVKYNAYGEHGVVYVAGSIFFFDDEGKLVDLEDDDNYD